jgi:hypothetical protein
LSDHYHRKQGWKRDSTALPVPQKQRIETSTAQLTQTYDMTMRKIARKITILTVPPPQD